MHPSSVADLLPDLPRWVEIRGMLLANHAAVFGLSLDPSPAFVVARPETGLIGVAGTPPAECIHQAIGQAQREVSLLAAPESRAWVAAALPGWVSQRAALHVLTDPGRLPADTDPVRLIGVLEIGALDTLPQSLRRELLIDAEAGAAIAAAWVDGHPVSFCYPGSVTERWWDISIDTLEPYRRQGHAARCVAFQVARMRALGQEPVWGAVDSNPASACLAAKLGFERMDEIFVFSAPGGS